MKKTSSPSSSSSSPATTSRNIVVCAESATASALIASITPPNIIKPVKAKRSVTVVEPKKHSSPGHGSTARNHTVSSIEYSSSSSGNNNLPVNHLHPNRHELHDYDASDQLNFLPIVFHPSYDISFFKIHKLHPFDSKKWGRIASEVDSFLTNKSGTSGCSSRRTKVQFLTPKRIVSKEELQVIHTKKFVDRIHSSRRTIVMATEVALLAFLPMKVINTRLLTPLKWQVSGSILAGKVALDQSWAIHLGGGFHHCSSESPGGFCLFADISLMIKFLWNHVNQSFKFLILDLDAHQGNGHERDVLFTMTEREQSLIYIMDVFNPDIYPRDHEAKEGINRCIEVKSRTPGQAYLNLVSYHLKAALDDFAPDLVIFNAGTDILEGDPLGKLSVDFDSVVKRDQIVFTEVMYRRHSIGKNCLRFFF